jgi:hypothetical protein
MERRVFFLCLLSFLMLAEGVSWFTAGGLGPCLIESERGQQPSKDLEPADCPTFFAGSLLSFERGYEWIKRDDNDKAVVATFTAVLAMSTIGLWLATNKLWRAGERQFGFTQQSIGLARDEFNATHRPKIRVKHLWLAGDIWGGETIVVNLAFVNNGTAEAIINEMGIKFVVVRKGQAIPFDPHIPAVRGVVIAGGRMSSGIGWRIEGIEDGTVLTDAQNTAIQNGKAILYCIGYMSYLDASERMRITGFCRVLTFADDAIIAQNCRFRVFDDPDYEYED